MDHEYWMDLCLKLASQADNRIRSNPKVGCVIIKENRIIGKGFHEVYGEAHAEVKAFANAKEDVQGGTLYVNLEPCSHYGKTPPCCEKIVEKEISKVVIAMEDPNPLVAGKGIQYLKDHGVDVVLDIRKREAENLNRIFLHYIKSGLPYVFLKGAMSLDGKIATKTGESQWISCEESRELTHSWRGEYQGILAGIGTILKDNPRLTARGNKGENPIRIILDSSLRIPLDAKILSEKGKNIIFYHHGEKEKLEALKDFENTELAAVSLKEEELHLSEVLKVLGQKGISSIFVEGGSRIFDSFFREKAADECAIFIAPLIIGGEEGISLVGGKGISRLEDSYRLKEWTAQKIGEDFLLRGRKETLCLQES